ncbi:MAG: hypothetical protein F4Y39_21980 [Gemmatimonadetes bacterium]|nr:hypothetical protein [Gemmatimonadota bacterium]
MTGALPQSLSGLTKLEQFQFHNTGLCAPLDAAFQTWLQGIEETNGSNCGAGLSVCDRTNAVRDGIMAQVPVSACGDVTGVHLSAINSLILDDASLTELKAGDLSGLTGLTTLSLEGNQLSSLPDGFFDDLTALTWLYLGDNQLTSIPSELFTLPNLTHLHLWGNQLVGAIPTALGSLSNLTELDLGDNQLSGAIPTALGNLSNLTLLALHNNQLSGRIPTELGKLSNLELLSLEDNTSLTGALPQSLTGLIKLKEFYFTNTGLCAPLDAAFQTWLQGITDASGSNCSG